MSKTEREAYVSGSFDGQARNLTPNAAVEMALALFPNKPCKNVEEIVEQFLETQECAGTGYPSDICPNCLRDNLRRFYEFLRINEETEEICTINTCRFYDGTVEEHCAAEERCPNLTKKSCKDVRKIVDKYCADEDYQGLFNERKHCQCTIGISIEGEPPWMCCECVTSDCKPGVWSEGKIVAKEGGQEHEFRGI